jgi:hypothetical protein
LNPELKALLDRYAAAGATDDELRQVASDWTAKQGAAPAAPAAPADNSPTLRDVGRSLLQGATFGFGDELGMTDRAKEKQFAAAHPYYDFGLKMLGGAVAPAAAVFAAPELQDDSRHASVRRCRM